MTEIDPIRFVLSVLFGARPTDRSAPPWLS